MRFTAPTILVLVLCVGLTGFLCAQDADQLEEQPIQPTDASTVDPLLEEARTLTAEGKLRDAADAYTRWLGENTGHPDLGDILIEAADSQFSVARSLELLRIYTPRVRDPLQKEVCRAYQIDILTMLGRTEQALGLLRSYPLTPWWLYRQAVLLHQQGLAEAAEKSLEQALKALLSPVVENVGNNHDDNHDNHDETELEARIRLLQARIYVLAAKHKEAESLFQLLVRKYAATDLAPAIHFAYYEYLHSQSRRDAAETQFTILAEEFPGSPELALARFLGGEGKIGYTPTPGRLLPPVFPMPEEQSQTIDRQESEKKAGQVDEEEQTPAAVEKTAPIDPAEPESQTVLVQAGSFRDLENAQYMVRDLEVGGFDAEIMEKQIGGTLYYRVVIGPLQSVDKAQAVLMMLKDSSFEGVLLFPD